MVFSDAEFAEAESELAAGDPEDATFTPLYANHFAWLVVVRDAELPTFGPPGRRTRSNYEATLAVFVDAETGRDLEAVTLPPNEAGLSLPR